MTKVSQSEHDHHIVLDVPHIVAKQFRDFCREKSDESNTIAGKQRYCGLANQIERELDISYEELYDNA